MGIISRPPRTGQLTHRIVGSDGYTDIIRALAIDSSGRAVMGGWSLSGFPGSLYSFAAARYTTSGDLDTTFGTGGTVAVDFLPLSANHDDSGANALVIQSDGKIVLAGSVGDISPQRFSFGVARLNTDGSLDSSYGTGGINHDDQGTNDDYAYAAAVQSDNKVVVVGRNLNGAQYSWMIQRWGTDGTLDTSFGTAGRSVPAMGFSSGGIAIAYAVAIQSDGKIIVAGDGYFSGVHKFTICRLDTNGALDTSFGTSGITTVALNGSNAITGISLQSNGKIVAVGTDKTGSVYKLAVLRFTSAGLLDTTFGSSGSTLISFDGSTTVYASSIVTQSDGKIVVGGYSLTNMLLARLTAAGAIDSTFGDGHQSSAGTILLQRVSGVGYNGASVGSQDLGMALAVQSNDKLIIGGYSRFMPLADPGAPPETSFAFSGAVCAIMRTSSTGFLDSTFGQLHPIPGNPGQTLTDYWPTNISGVLYASGGFINGRAIGTTAGTIAAGDHTHAYIGGTFGATANVLGIRGADATTLAAAGVTCATSGATDILQSVNGALYARASNGVGIRVVANGSGYAEVQSDVSTLQIGSNAVIVQAGSGGPLLITGGSVRAGSGGTVGFSSAADPMSGGTDASFFRAAASVIGISSGGTFSSAPLSPSQITGNQDNYAPGVAAHYRLSSDASRNITGLSVGQVDGHKCEIWNVGAQNIVLKNADAGSSTANRFLNSGGGDITLAGGEMAFLRWFAAEQSSSGGWRVVKG